MKRANLFLAVLSLLALTGCGSPLTVDEARTYAKENYSLTKAAETYVRYTEREVVKVKKATGIFKDYALEEKDETETDVIADAPILTSAFFLSLPNTAEITLNSGSISVYVAIDAKDAIDMQIEGITGQSTYTLKTNNLGLYTSEVEKVKFKVDASANGITVKGELEAESVKTYTYQKK
jgi:lipoprotein